MLARVLLSLAPILAAATFAFAGFYLYTAARLGLAGDWPYAAFYLLFGIGGLALSLSLWRVFRRARTAVRGPRDARDARDARDGTGRE